MAKGESIQLNYLVCFDDWPVNNTYKLYEKIFWYNQIPKCYELFICELCIVTKSKIPVMRADAGIMAVIMMRECDWGRN